MITLNDQQSYKQAPEGEEAETLNKEDKESLTSSEKHSI